MVLLLLNQIISLRMSRQIIRISKRRKVYSYFGDNIWGFDLADMQPLSKYSKGIKYLLCAIYLFSKYPWVVPWKDKKGISIVNAFQKMISKRRKPYEKWVDQGGEFHNKSFKRFLKRNNNVFNIKLREICCCWKIYSDIKKQDF